MCAARAAQRSKLAAVAIRPARLFLLPRVSRQVMLRADGCFEFGRSFLAGEVVADTERIAADFVDAREGLALVRSVGAGEGQSLGLGSRIEFARAAVELARDRDLVLAIKGRRRRGSCRYVNRRSAAGPFVAKRRTSSTAICHGSSTC